MLAHPPTKNQSSHHTFQACAFSALLSNLAFVGAHAIQCIEPFDNATYYFLRIMRVSNFILIVVLSCIARIGATPLGVGNGTPAGAIAHRERCVPCYNCSYGTWSI